MLFLLSPAKSLDYVTPAHTLAATEPLFQKQAARLIATLQTRTPAAIASLMHLSGALAALNVARYAAWSAEPAACLSKQAILAFDGDVYTGLDAKSLSAAQLDWAQEHLCILSGLYGVLRPLDRMQPHRLEMGTALTTSEGRNLYRFWGRQIADYLNARAAANVVPVIVNLASEEYFKAVDRTALRARVVTCVFEELRGSRWRVISFSAKRARGLMARHAIAQRIQTIDQLRGFAADGYRFDASASTIERLVFRRRQPGT